MQSAHAGRCTVHAAHEYRGAAGCSAKCAQCRVESREEWRRWVHLNVWPVSGKPGPAAIHCTLIPSCSCTAAQCTALVHSSSQESRQKPCKASDIFSALLCSNAASLQRGAKIILQNPVLLFLPLHSSLFTLSIDKPPERFLSIRFLLLFLPTNDPTDEPSPLRDGFQPFALHISPTFASNLKSCPRQIQNLFRKNRAPWIFHLRARARVQSSIACLMNLTEKSKK